MSGSTPLLGDRPRQRRVQVGDVVAGISVAFIVVPQGLAYAELAGLPSYVGLYAAALPSLLAAYFASSRYLQTGPVAMTSLLTFGALSGLAAPQSAEYVRLALAPRRDRRCDPARARARPRRAHHPLHVAPGRAGFHQRCGRVDHRLPDGRGSSASKMLPATSCPGCGRSWLIPSPGTGRRWG